MFWGAKLRWAALFHIDNKIQQTLSKISDGMDTDMHFPVQ